MGWRILPDLAAGAARGPVLSAKPDIAIIGTRGIPARYGGFETLAEELAVRLVELGFGVTVYCRSQYTDRALREYRGVRLVVLPAVRTKHLDTPTHTMLSCLHAAARGYDAVLVVNAANAVFLPLLRARGIPVALNVDGIERQRAKWGALGRAVYSSSERLATLFSDRLVADAEVIRQYYREHYGARPTVIAYGVEPRPQPPGPTLEQLGLEPRRYFLYVSRFEPENNPHRVAEAYRSVSGDLPLVMVGGAPYAAEFIRGFTEGADPRILFPGPIYGEGYRELLTHALAYVQATEVGGTHPALVEAMGYGNCLLVNDVPEHLEVTGDVAWTFDVGSADSLREAFEKVLSDPAEAARRGREAAERARQRYTWSRVADQYADLLRSLVRNARR